ncbi:hypothetical protein OH77DRAFT_1272289 [Trametes cingulata]|nr:hypothetical protein OH77DRAFT_1272289 [Trametes cingulata]
MPASSNSKSTLPDANGDNARLSDGTGDDSSSYRDLQNEDSEEESEEEADGDDEASGKAPPLDSSDDEDSRAAQRRSKKGRPAGRPSEATDIDAPHSKAPRFNWSSGNGLRAQKYLATRYYEWETASGEDRKAILRRAAEHIISEWSFPKHNAGDVRQAAVTWLRNQRAALQRGEIQEPGGPRVKPTALAAASAPQTVPRNDREVRRLTKKIKDRATSAAHLWARANPEKVLKKLSGSSIGERQQVVKELFSKLSEAEQREWKDKAKAARTEEQENPNQCFENQQGFEALLARLLTQFVGFGPDGVGAVIIDLRIGLREEDGSVSQTNLTVGLPPNHVAYDSYEGGADVNEQGQWDRFLASALPPNPARRDPRLVYAEDGTPSLPTPDKSWTQEGMASTLDAYYRAIWAEGRRGVNTLSVDWEAITRDPNAYLTKEWQEQGIQEPATLSWDRIPVVYGNLLKAQAAGEPFRFVQAATEAVPQPASTATGLPADSTASGATVLGASGGAQRGSVPPSPYLPQTPSTRYRTVVYKTPERSRPGAREGEGPGSSTALPSVRKTVVGTTLERIDEETGPTNRVETEDAAGGLVLIGGSSASTGGLFAEWRQSSLEGLSAQPPSLDAQTEDNVVQERPAPLDSTQSCETTAEEPHAGSQDVSSCNVGQAGPGLRQGDAVLQDTNYRKDETGSLPPKLTEPLPSQSLPPQAATSSRGTEDVAQEVHDVDTASVVGLPCPPESTEPLPSQSLPPQAATSSRGAENVDDPNGETVDGAQRSTEDKGTAGADDSISTGPELGMSGIKTVRSRKRARESARGDVVVEGPATKRLTRRSVRMSQDGTHAAADTHAEPTHVEPATGSSAKQGRKSIGHGPATRVTRSISAGNGKRKGK